MNYIVVDASIWVSRLVSEDVFHGKTRDWMKAQRDENVEFLAPSLLLAEVGGAISRRTGEPDLGEKAIEQLQNLPGLRLIEMDNGLVREAAQLAAVVVGIGPGVDVFVTATVAVCVGMSVSVASGASGTGGVVFAQPAKSEIANT